MQEAIRSFTKQRQTELDENQMFASLETLGDQIRSCQAEWEAACAKEQAQRAVWQSAVRKREQGTMAEGEYLEIYSQYMEEKKSGTGIHSFPSRNGGI